MMEENKYTSVFMYQDVSKDDIENFKKDYKYKKDKIDILFYLSFLVIIAGIITLIFTAGGMLIILAGIALLLWRYSKIISLYLRKN